MSDDRPILLWLRRGDLRLADQPALSAAAATGAPIIPVFFRDSSVDRLGAAARWRLERALDALAQSLARHELPLILRSGAPEAALATLALETGARALYLCRHTDGDPVAFDSLKERLPEVRVFDGNRLFHPAEIRNASGGPFRVFTAMWRAMRGADIAPPAPVPPRLRSPEQHPSSERLADWKLGAGVRHGGSVLARHCEAGEEAAQARLAEFLEDDLRGYETGRDRLADDACSRLSPFLANGEIGIRQCWHAGLRARDMGNPGAEPFLRQLMWREFAAHLLWHAPELDKRCWRPEWEAFPWSTDETRSEIRAWKRGRTGVALVDAAMREMMVTGVMQNRARMVVASYLSKHLMADWRIGLRWFEAHLVDWDAANNALGWQWVAGCGPDASPFFRVFNPDTQAKKFDPDGVYRRRWLAEGTLVPEPTALEYFEAAPRAWTLSPSDPEPAPVVGLKEGREAALAGWHAFRNQGSAEL
ncbi:deoxyribodipyrimidine photo-lyase [Tropicimonas sp. TH_r6]|uniref:cryptochrome/photolyase family protein n=1 Tax=Tropicimonas sp. TH_r6 TaxID=3082085 RepID=UPI002953FD3F|nr:deoxyribodipyrimidine photo-lyase [Tropicimonas sp. TH_r6]MDV7144438.1 deoxyribodipyrimidine photo-lyase [Tropicimonas sp. TH_r6]